MGLIYFLALLCHVTAELFKCRLVRLHFRNGGGGGGGKSQKGISNFCTLFWHGGQRSNLAPFVLGGYFAQQLFSNFFFYFCIELPRNELSKDDFA